MNQSPVKIINLRGNLGSLQKHQRKDHDSTMVTGICSATFLIGSYVRLTWRCTNPLDAHSIPYCRALKHQRKDRDSTMITSIYSAT